MNIHKAGKAEFLEKGFQGASLRQIVKNAGVTTGAFYGYYPGKAQLFDALVAKNAKELATIYCKLPSDISNISTENVHETIIDLLMDGTYSLLDYIYKYKITNKDQQQQIKSALSYIMQTLPQNIIGLLKYKSDGTLKGATNLIAQLAASQHNVESFIELDLQKNKDGEIEKKSKFSVFRE